MTKKHFIELANVVRTVLPSDSTSMLITPEDFEDEKSNAEAIMFDEGQRVMRERFIVALADFCQSQNSRFNRHRWLDYIAGDCGPNGGKVQS